MKKFLNDLVYTLDYIKDGRAMTTHLRPVDAANGVIMDERGGAMIGLTTTGHLIRVTLDAIVCLAKAEVTWRNNQGTHNTSYWSDRDVADHLKNASIKVEGEEVYRKQPEDRIPAGGKSGGQLDIFG
jgi:hypothetical protein